MAATVAAAIVGVAAAAGPAVGSAGGKSGPSMSAQLSTVLADQRWPAPKPGSWTPPKAAVDGLPTVINKIDTQDKVVFLTIDDGYEYDSQFVDIVRKERVPILTFLTTTYVRGEAQYFWAMRNAGSQIEDHTVTHPNMATLPLESQKREICQSADTITAQYGRRPMLFRPPFGSYNTLTRQAAKACGMKSILLWTAEFYNGTSGPGVGFNGFARGDGAGTGFRPGDIVLMHYRKGLAGQFQMLLGWIKQQGFRPAAIQEYLPRSLGGNAPDAPPATP
ncbi:polysaccharide deacetylase family protein [Actinomadura rubteroloni]|uniref:polysaccharide deacetylase family protein n=1 Tax=Actinomadura rubteroloni TaxID=1926885 RepID=UPI001F206646|nr:polysaccharide deacetylase family protein [Actinomadura rubteroloni]